MTRRALLDTATRTTKTRTTPDRRKGEPVVTAIWMTVSATTLVLGLSLPWLEAVGSPMQPYVVPFVAFLYATALGASCAYNRLRYGRIWLTPAPQSRTRPPVRDRRAAQKPAAKPPLAVMIG